MALFIGYAYIGLASMSAGPCWYRPVQILLRMHNSRTSSAPENIVLCSAGYHKFIFEKINLCYLKLPNFSSAEEGCISIQHAEYFSRAKSSYLLFFLDFNFTSQKQKSEVISESLDLESNAKLLIQICTMLYSLQFKVSICINNVLIRRVMKKIFCMIDDRNSKYKLGQNKRQCERRKSIQ